ncbi:MAG: hypothetical protein PHR61_04140 [Candidatus Absconditabacteria bacterium]|nr:hypothetical protein [Candidatus Absconditabacteria bacterium]
MKAKLEAKEWFENLFAYGESQLSALFGTRSDLCDELEKKGFIVSPSNISQDEIMNVRNYKSNYFDKEKRDFYSQNIKITGLKGIAIWKPVWEYLISQIPNAYVFSGKSLFLQAKQEFIVHDKGELPVFDFYLAGNAPSSPRFLEELYIGEEEKDKQLQFTKKIAVLSFIIPIIPLILTIFVGNFIGISSFVFILGTLGIIFYLRNRNFKRYFFVSRKKVFQKLFPNKKLLTDELVEYLAFNKPVSVVGINLFKDEQVGALYHQRLIKEGLNPSYVQLTCYVSIFAKYDNKFHRVIGKEKSIDPILFFEENEIIIIPFEEIQNHPIMRYFIEQIDISKLDIPRIIADYISKKLKITDNKIA